MVERDRGASGDAGDLYLYMKAIFQEGQPGKFLAGADAWMQGRLLGGGIG